MKFNIGILVGTVIVAVVLIMSACKSSATYHEPHCPVCDEHNPTEEHLNTHCATNYKVEEPVLNGEWGETQIGSHDFFLYGEPVGLEGYCACNCCGVYIMDDPDIVSEHLKTCCP